MFFTKVGLYTSNARGIYWKNHFGGQKAKRKQIKEGPQF